MVYTISGIRLPAVPSACKWSRSTSNGNRNTNLSLLLKDSFCRNVFAGMSSPGSDSSSVMVAATNKILVPGSQGDGSLSLTEQLESPETVQEDPQVWSACTDVMH
ncbi:hypothetical protein F2P56_005763 [Juglans regia]|uniref:Uncharacterized protein n=1 Tax=Juglans regia TaxID=51240 RepID=A0A833Y1X5_JUGRE|nr:hypothetical protein F2P56_005763 [Juglans regia]